MRHRVAGRKLGRSYGQRKALFRTMVTQLLEHGRIRTTEAKAKAIRAQAEKMITLGKRGDLHARRRARPGAGGQFFGEVEASASRP